MNLHEYQKLPEIMDGSDLVSIFEEFFKEAKTQDPSEWMPKLEILCEKQWYTYEKPDAELKEKTRSLLINNWSWSDDYLRLVLTASQSFGLDKSLFCKALGKYQGRGTEDFQRVLQNSVGDDIDPYWSFKNDSRG